MTGVLTDTESRSEPEPRSDAEPFLTVENLTVQFPTAGTFPFVCNLHPGMNGTAIVNP